MTKPNELLTTKEAAKHVRLSHRTLERYRVTGEGPQFLKVRRLVFYRHRDLDEWLGKTVRRSTSDPGPETEQETKKRKARRGSTTGQAKRRNRRPPSDSD